MRQHGGPATADFLSSGGRKNSARAIAVTNCSTARDQKQSFEINVPSQAPTPVKPNLVLPKNSAEPANG
jgi:hypothetical protein